MDQSEYDKLGELYKDLLINYMDLAKEYWNQFQNYSTLIDEYIELNNKLQYYKDKYGEKKE